MPKIHFINGAIRCLYIGRDDEEIAMEHSTESETLEPNKSDPNILKAFIG